MNSIIKYLASLINCFFTSVTKHQHTFKWLKYVLVGLMFLGTLNTQATTYYGKTSLAPNLVASWGINSGGSGSNPTNFTTAGDIFIIESGTTMTASAIWTIGLTSSTTASTLQINNGGTLSMRTFLLTLASCNFTNSGTFTSTTGGVTITGIATQNIAGFTTTGNVTFTKVSGTATISGNVSAVNLTISSTTSGVLVLAGSNTFSGTRTVFP